MTWYCYWHQIWKHRGKLFHKYDPTWIPWYRVEKKLTYENYIVRQLGTHNTLCVNRIRLRPVRPRHKPEDLDEIDPKKFTADPHMPDRYLEPWVFDNNLAKVVQQVHQTLEPPPNEEPNNLPYGEENEEQPALVIPFKILVYREEESWDAIQREMYKHQASTSKERNLQTPRNEIEARKDFEVKQTPRKDFEVKQTPTEDWEVRHMEREVDEPVTSHQGTPQVAPGEGEEGAASGDQSPQIGDQSPRLGTSGEDSEGTEGTRFLDSPENTRQNMRQDYDQSYLWINASPDSMRPSPEDNTTLTENPEARCISPYERPTLAEPQDGP